MPRGLFRLVGGLASGLSVVQNSAQSHCWKSCRTGGRVRIKFNGKVFKLMYGWNKVRFDLLKKEAGPHAKIVIICPIGEKYLVPITDCEWIGE